MKKRSIVLASAFIASALVASATAAEPSFEGFTSWAKNEARADLNNQHPTAFSGTNNGCEFAIASTSIWNNTEDRWYLVESDDAIDTKLWYQKTNGSWEMLSDDNGSGRNYCAVLYAPARTTHNLKLNAGYFNAGATNKYWHSVTKSNFRPAKASNVPYFQINNDGTLTQLN